jgi:hypothetical protein
MRLFYKYEFETEKQADEFIGDLDKSDFKAIGVVKLGFLITISPTFKKDGTIKKKAVYAPKFSVDAIFENIEPPSWKAYRIELGKLPSSHNFAGVNYSENNTTLKT